MTPEMELLSKFPQNSELAREFRSVRLIMNGWQQERAVTDELIRMEAARAKSAKNIDASWEQTECGREKAWLGPTNAGYTAGRGQEQAVAGRKIITGTPEFLPLQNRAAPFIGVVGDGCLKLLHLPPCIWGARGSVFGQRNCARKIFKFYSNRFAAHRSCGAPRERWHCVTVGPERHANPVLTAPGSKPAPAPRRAHGALAKELPLFSSL
jgi:hypothetical protein